jgi:hypothetical protein
MNLAISQQASIASSHSLILTGSARSGTTIVGRLLASCRDVEYGFEPPTLVALWASLGSLPDASWKLLYETYLYEELLLGSLAGRYLNTNRIDDSCAYEYMIPEEVEQRLHGAFRKLDLEAQIELGTIRICYKIPDLLPLLDQLKAFYPESTPIVMRRKVRPTLRSLLQKGWFDAGPAGDSSTRIYPFRIALDEASQKCHIPYWVTVEDEAWWLTASAEQRSLYYYVLNTPSDSEDFYVIDYEQMLLDPMSTFQQLSHQFKLQPGALTDSILNSIKPQDAATKDQATSGYDLDIDKLVMCLPAKMQFRASALNL